jgi:hypothetical protein
LSHKKRTDRLIYFAFDLLHFEVAICEVFRLSNANRSSEDMPAKEVVMERPARG